MGQYGPIWSKQAGSYDVICKQIWTFETASQKDHNNYQPIWQSPYHHHTITRITMAPSASPEALVGPQLGLRAVNGPSAGPNSRIFMGPCLELEQIVKSKIWVKIVKLMVTHGKLIISFIVVHCGSCNGWQWLTVVDDGWQWLMMIGNCWWLQIGDWCFSLSMAIPKVIDVY